MFDKLKEVAKEAAKKAGELGSKLGSKAKEGGIIVKEKAGEVGEKIKHTVSSSANTAVNATKTVATKVVEAKPKSEQQVLTDDWDKLEENVKKDVDELKRLLKVELKLRAKKLKKSI